MDIVTVTQLPSKDVNGLIEMNPRFLEWLHAEKKSSLPDIRISDVTVLPTATEAKLRLTLSNRTRNSVHGTWLTRNGTGTNEGTNYVRATGHFVFHPGERTEQEITIQLKGNNAPGKDIQVVLSGTVEGGTIVDGLGKIFFSESASGGQKSGFRLDWEHNFVDGFAATDTGLLPDGTPCWQSRPAHGRTQPNNKELGLYVDPDLYPATNPFPVVDGKRLLRSEFFPEGVLDSDGDQTLCTWLPIKDAAGKTIGYEPFRYTASMINSKKMRTVEVGDRLEARFAMPVIGSRAAWPAFWLLPMPPYNWPPEIDVMEYPIDHKHNPWTYYTTQHWTTTSGANLHLSYPIDTRTLGATQDLSNFHTYGVEITPEEIKFDFDGVTTRIQENRVPSASWYILLNMAFGGTWPGGPTSATTMPCDMVLDWIKHYKPL
ncbi:putative glycosyl hydrolase family 16 laminarinase [Sinorhizobium phage phiM9]|uniref:Putative glycosyl hydrolase family 16 laminarinase n=1 Tax=Sinorhizobium phage phiM9 TaxID=1636182 RepID=A0A0F6TGM9_9CAUD|nr:putative glycosyl hydrolase family 16 laminarinase [Sinorhizobium phage phiM9]AKE44749.1 putative glycosyl hydrolase family 16 laminarinase [Sinorhizobium phage phiM9]